MAKVEVNVTRGYPTTVGSKYAFAPELRRAAKFQLAINDLGTKGEGLSGEKMTALYLDILKRYHGPNVRIEPDYESLPKTPGRVVGPAKNLPFPSKYTDEDGSGLTATVKPQENPLEPFQLK